MAKTTFSARQIGANILAKAISHIGEREQPPGSNSGPDIQKYQEEVPTDNPHDPWCAKFASYITTHTLAQMGVALPHLVTASSHVAVDWARRNHTVQTPKTALPGDWCILRGGDGEPASDGEPYHHTTILERIEDGRAFYVAGNDGNQVRRNSAPLSGVCLLRPYVQ